MGIKSFYNITVSLNPESEFFEKPIIELGVEIKLKDLAGKRLAFDASNMIYSAILAMSRVHALTDSEGRTTAHLNTILQQVLMFRKEKIGQIWCFDPKEIPEMKRRELAKRAERREKSDNEKVQFKMTDEHVQDIQKLLGLLGIIYIIAPAGIEAEQYAAYLTIPKPGKGAMCEYVYSNDADVLMFGGHQLRPMSVPTASGKSKKKVYKVFRQDRLLEHTGLTRTQLVMMGVAMGTDFAEKIRGVGPKSAVKRALDDKIVLDETQQRAYDYFMQDVAAVKPQIFKSEPNIPELIDWLTGRGFKRERLEKMLANYSSV